VFVTAATELATVAELEVKEALLSTVAEPVVAPFVDPPTAGATALEKTAEEPWEEPKEGAEDVEGSYVSPDEPDEIVGELTATAAEDPEEALLEPEDAIEDAEEGVEDVAILAAEAEAPEAPTCLL